MDNKCLDFYKILEVAPITEVIEIDIEGRSMKVSEVIE